MEACQLLRQHSRGPPRAGVAARGPRKQGLAVVTPGPQWLTSEWQRDMLLDGLRRVFPVVGVSEPCWRSTAFENTRRASQTNMVL